uniref:glucoside xylosyltransferase 2-like n=1 Tax=Ciona intestinalis TaxID=7719 RepID=UPI000180CD1F|nr:glucoside xylosyltransferase 2-like [Ciona intestinalis]|eukprot:XP_018667666.1 glucoside xylosyltransferase 2-like [Ciona intestinalis]
MMCRFSILGLSIVICVICCSASSELVSTHLSDIIKSWKTDETPSMQCSLFFDKINFMEHILQQCLIKRKLLSTTPNINVAVVACGEDDRVEETLVNIKTIALFAKSKTNFHIFTEPNLFKKFHRGIQQWPSCFRSRFTHKLYPITYPNDGQNWRSLFKICASQRLFLPNILTNVDSLLYVDTDILFLSPVDDIWAKFKKFNSTQLSAMSPEHENPRVGWYSRFARHPYYGDTGINSGVMLINMTRLRSADFKNDVQKSKLKWDNLLLPLFRKYSSNLTWGDQDILNIIFHHNPEMLYVMSCYLNYRPDHCMYMQMCGSAVENGVSVMHGCRRSFHNDKWPSFKAVYKAFKDYSFYNPLSSLLQEIKKNLDKSPHSQCKLSSEVVIMGLQKTIEGII